MSGDNLHGKQPIKFYSEKITLTKVELLERQLSQAKKYQIQIKSIKNGVDNSQINQ